MAINQLDFYYYFMKSETKPSQGVINAVLKIDGSQANPISTRIKTKKDLWNSKQQCFEGKESAKKEALKALFEKRMSSIRDEMSADNPRAAIDPNEIVKLHRENKRALIEANKPVGKIKESFLEHFRMHLSSLSDLIKAGRMTESSFRVYLGKQATITEFLRSKRSITMRTENFDISCMMDFKNFLILKGLSDATIQKYEQLIKTVSTYAKRKGFTKSKPLDDYTVTKAAGKEPITLEADELQLIENLRLSGKLHPDLCITADIYRFCAETSLSNIDYNNLKNSMLTISKTGTWWIHTTRQKSDVKQRIPMSIKAIEIVERYGSLELLPRKSNYHLNQGIRVIAERCGIKKRLTFHTSRKSAVNNMYNDKGMRETTIQSIVGWKTGDQFKLYTRVSDQTIEDEFFKN